MKKYTGAIIAVAVILIVIGIASRNSGFNLRNSDQAQDNELTEETGENGEIMEKEAEVMKAKESVTTPVANKGFICGTVILSPGASGFDPSPLANTQISIFSGTDTSPVSTAVTNALGNFVSSELSFGSYVITETKYGTSQNINLTIAGCNNTTMSVGLPSSGQ